jgi:hypothetical protein
LLLPVATQRFASSTTIEATVAGVQETPSNTDLFLVFQMFQETSKMEV